MRLNQHGFSASLVLLGITVLILIGLAGFYVYDKNEKDEPPQQNTISTQQVSHDPSKLIDYRKDNQNGVSIIEASDTEKLDKASDSFKQFITDDLKIYQEDETFAAPGCDIISISVFRIYDDEFAVGRVTQCGTEDDHIWKQENGKWSKIISGSEEKDQWSCQAIDRYEVPNIIIKKCQDSKSYKVDGDKYYKTIENPN